MGQANFLRWTNEIDCIFTVFRDVYVGSNALVSDGTNIIESGNTTGPDCIYNSWPGPVIKHVLTGIAFFHGSPVFGHLIADTLYPLMALSMEFLKASTIFYLWPVYSYQKEFFDFLGLFSNVVYLKYNEWVHCDSLISATHPMPHTAHFGTLPYKLSLILREKLNLTKIEPRLYGFMRRHAKNRMITNLDECMAALKARVLHIKWKIFDQNLRDLVESARLHAKMKVFGNVCGSNSHKVIFMSPKSIVIFVNTNIWDYSVYLPPASIGMKIIWFMTKDWEHFTDHSVDPERFAKAFEVAAYYAANNKWPDPAQYNAFIDVL